MYLGRVLAAGLLMTLLPSEKRPDPGYRVTEGSGLWVLPLRLPPHLKLWNPSCRVPGPPPPLPHLLGVSWCQGTLLRLPSLPPGVLAPGCGFPQPPQGPWLSPAWWSSAAPLTQRPDTLQPSWETGKFSRDGRPWPRQSGGHRSLAREDLSFSFRHLYLFVLVHLGTESCVTSVQEGGHPRGGVMVLSLFCQPNSTSAHRFHM